jgi:putative spermidine/putrescine transport system substrate-binding protein
MNELVGALLRAEGFVEPWPISKVPNLSKLHPAASIDQNRGVTIGVSPVGIAYRTDLVKTPPKSWKDLWDNPELKGKLALFTISNTAGYMFLMSISKIFGNGPFDFDAGFREIEKLKPFPQADLAGAMAVLLTRGEAVAGPLDVGEVVTLQKRGAPIGFAVPSEELFAFDQTFYLMKNGPNKDAACAFLNYMLSEDVQAKLAEEFSLVPANTSTKLAPALAAQLPVASQDLGRIVTFDWTKANQERASVTERWNRMTR